MKQICTQKKHCLFANAKYESTFGIPIADEDVIDLDSSNDAKFSHHLIFNNPVSSIQYLDKFLFYLAPNLQNQSRGRAIRAIFVCQDQTECSCHSKFNIQNNDCKVQKYIT